MNGQSLFKKIMVPLLASAFFAAGCGDDEESITLNEGDGNQEVPENQEVPNNQDEGNDDTPEMVDRVPEFFESATDDVYGDESPGFTVIADGSDGVQDPNDLEFHPHEERAQELWILNEGTIAQGGSTVTLYEAGEEDQEAEWLRDGNAWHFMSMPSAMAFGDNGHWATTTAVQDANHQDGSFAGPSLWSSDMEIYAEVGDPPTAEVNGSHLDMLHGSPHSMGVAHEIDNAYWVYDGYHGYIVRYDFVEPHPPGGSDHSNGRIHRYKEVEIERDESVPSHMILDKGTGWLYINDTGNQQVIRLNIDSGSKDRDLALINEPLAEHIEIEGVEWEVFIDDGLEAPSGMTLRGDRLFVTDYQTGDIIAYDIDTGEELARIQTDAGVRGITVGPDDKLWFVNYVSDEVVRIDPN